MLGAIGCDALARPPAGAPALNGLAEDLTAAWNAPGVTMRARQRFVRTLITDIIAEVARQSPRLTSITG